MYTNNKERKWTAAYLDHAFDIKNISHGAFRCLIQLQSAAYWTGNKTKISNAQLATTLGCDKRTVTRYILELKKAKCFTADVRVQQRNNEWNSVRTIKFSRNKCIEGSLR